MSAIGRAKALRCMKEMCDGKSLVRVLEDVLVCHFAMRCVCVCVCVYVCVCTDERSVRA